MKVGMTGSLIITGLMVVLACPISAQNPTGREIPKSEKKKEPAKKESSTPRKSAPARTRRTNSGFNLTIVAPAGSIIEFDGKPRGVANIEGRLLLRGIKPGPHQLKVTANGYEPWQGSSSRPCPTPFRSSKSQRRGGSR